MNYSMNLSEIFTGNIRKMGLTDFELVAQFVFMVRLRRRHFRL